MGARDLDRVRIAALGQQTLTLGLPDSKLLGQVVRRIR
jgi:hypothetical protein